MALITADSKDDAAADSKDYAEDHNSMVSQTGYHSAPNCVDVATPKICDAAPTEALAKLSNAPMATTIVTIGTQCDAVKMVLQPGYVETSAKPTTYNLIGEHFAVLKHVCAFYDIHVRRTALMLNSGRRKIFNDAAAVLQSIRQETPTLLWIQWH